MTVIHKLSGSVLLEKVTEAQVVKKHPAFFTIWITARSHTTLLRLGRTSFRVNCQTAPTVFSSVRVSIPSLMAALFKAWVCGHSLAGNAGSNPAAAMDVCLLLVLSVR